MDNPIDEAHDYVNDLEQAIRAALDILRPTLPGTFMPDRVRKAIVILEGVIDED